MIVASFRRQGLESSPNKRTQNSAGHVPEASSAPIPRSGFLGISDHVPRLVQVLDSFLVSDLEQAQHKTVDITCCRNVNSNAKHWIKRFCHAVRCLTQYPSIVACDDQSYKRLGQIDEPLLA